VSESFDDIPTEPSADYHQRYFAKNDQALARRRQLIELNDAIFKNSRKRYSGDFKKV